MTARERAMTEATDEEVRKIKRAVFRYRYAWGYRETEHSECIDDLEKLLARLERVERELLQAEQERENALAALAGEPYPYPEVRRKK